MANLKVDNGMVSYKYKTFDGTFVEGKMPEAEAKVMASKAKDDFSIVGYELRNGNYYLQTETVSAKLSKSKTREEE